MPIFLLILPNIFIFITYPCCQNCNKALSPTHSVATISPPKSNVLLLSLRRGPTSRNPEQAEQLVLQAMEEPIRTQKPTFTLRRFPQRVHPQGKTQGDPTRTHSRTHPLGIPRKKYTFAGHRRQDFEHSLKKSRFPETCTKIWRFREARSAGF